MLACIKPPGSQGIHKTMALYIRSAAPDRSRISPSNTKKGMATKRKLLDVDQAISPMAITIMLALFSDGILEILPPKDLVDKEAYFLEVFGQTADSPEELVTYLGLDNVETVPDDIAALFLIKRG